MAAELEEQMLIQHLREHKNAIQRALVYLLKCAAEKPDPALDHDSVFSLYCLLEEIEAP